MLVMRAARLVQVLQDLQVFTRDSIYAIARFYATEIPPVRLSHAIGTKVDDLG